MTHATVNGDASVMVHVFDPDSMPVRTAAPAEPSLTPVRVRTARFGRYLPHIKHPATMGAVHLSRRGRADGYDDVLFVDDDGVISGGSTWNVVFFDGTSTVFPVAPMLTGTMLQLIRAGLATPAADRAVRVPELADLRGAALTNSINPARPLSAVDGVAVPVDDAWLATLRAAFAENVPEAV